MLRWYRCTLIRPSKLPSVTSSTVLTVDLSGNMAIQTHSLESQLDVASANTVSGIVQGPLKVDDVMTKKTLFSVREDTSIDEGVPSIRSQHQKPQCVSQCPPCSASLVAPPCASKHAKGGHGASVVRSSSFSYPLCGH